MPSGPTIAKKSPLKPKDAGGDSSLNLDVFQALKPFPIGVLSLGVDIVFDAVLQIVLA